MQVAASPYAPIGAPWTVAVSVDGPQDAAGVTLTYTIPTGTTFSSMNATDACTAPPPGSAGTIVCHADSLPFLPRLAVVLDVPAATPWGRAFTHAATVSASNYGAANATATSVARTSPAIDISTLCPSSLVAGEAFTYTITLRNTGVVDSPIFVLPTEQHNHSVLSRGLTQIAGWPLQCGFICSADSFPPGATATLVVAATTPWDLAGPIEVRPYVFFVDYGYRVDDEPHGATLTRVADFSVNVDGPPLAGVGDSIDYTVTVRNYGPSASDAVVTIDVPPTIELSAVSAPCTSGGATVTCHFASGYNQVQLVATAMAAGGATLTASVASVAPDPNPANDRGSVTTQVAASRQADVAASIESQTTSVAAGGIVEFTVAATNAGPSLAVRPKVTVTLPPDAEIVDHDDGCSGTPLVCVQPYEPLRPLQTDTWRLSVTFPNAGLATVTALATSDTVDPNPENDSASITTAVRPAVGDLQLSISSWGAASPGNDLSFVANVKNVGPDAVIDSAVVVQLPKNVQIIAIPQQCVAADDGARCPLARLAAGASDSVQIDLAAPDSPSVSVGFSAESGAVDPDPSNNSVTKTVAVTGLFADHDADLAISGTANATIAPGDLATIGGTIVNRGPTFARNVTVSFTDPVGASIESIDIGPPFTCQWAGDAATCTASLLTVGESAGWTVGLRATTGGPLVARVAGATHDPDLSNNTATTGITVPLPTLTVTVEPSQTVAYLGELTFWFITVTNNGASPADVTLDDPLSAGLTFVSALPSYGSCTSTLVCALGALTPGTRTTIQVTAIPQVWANLRHTISIRGSSISPVESTIIVVPVMPHRAASH